MRSRRTSFLISTVSLFGFNSASADVTVSGEARAYSSPVAQLQFRLNASGGDGVATGSAQYTRLAADGSSELELEMPVSCMWVADDAERVVVAGPATITSNPRSATAGEWFVIALQKRPAEKERVRALFATQREAAEMCEVGETVFPAIVDSGGFTFTQDDASPSNLFGTGRDVNIDPDRVGGSRDFPLPVPEIGSGGASDESGVAMGENSSQCTAHFRFNGTLEDSTGNGHDAILVGQTPVPSRESAQFESGKLGQALLLTGTEVAVAPLDLHFEACPKITISAWVMLKSEPDGQMTILSTGHGSGPRIALTKSNMSVWGGANEIRTRAGMWKPPVGRWFPIVASWDYEAGTHTLHAYYDSLTEELGNYSRVPQQDLWIGTYAYGSTLMNIGSDILIDDLRVYDRILEGREVTAALGDRLPVTPDCDCGEGIPQPVPGTENLFPRDTRNIPEEDRPASPPDLLNDAGYEVGVIDAPDTTPGRNLAAPEDALGQQLQDDIEAAQNAGPQTEQSGRDLEDYRTDAAGAIRTIDIVLPGTSQTRTVTYQEVDGLAIAEGDMILGSVSELGQWSRAVESEVPAGDMRTRRQGLNVIKNTKYLWPGGVIPYSFHSNMDDASEVLAIDAADTLSDETNLEVRPKTDDDENWVEFKMKDKEVDACSSRVGMKQSKGAQTIKVDPECGKVTLMHEILHAAGFWHEQSRPDRDQYVEILIDNVISSKRHNYAKQSAEDATGVGEYNYRSIMHYSETSFGKDCIRIGTSDDQDCMEKWDGTLALRTMRAKQPGANISRNFKTDVDAINAIYPAKVGPEMGLDWGDEYFATATAVGDIDGDGRGEIIVGRFANEGSRFFVYDDSSSAHNLIASGPTNWGANIEVTDLAVGDVDGDGVMEIGVARRTNTGSRYFVYRYNSGRLTQVLEGGDNWGAGYYATSIAFGDVDGDGRDEVAVGRKANESGRYFLFDDASASRPFRRLATGGSDWGVDHYTTALAFGDVDGDGRDEIGVARHATSGFRYEVVEYGNGSMTQLSGGGRGWGRGYYGTAIAFGNIDSDGAEEFVVGRRANEASRFYVVDDQSTGFQIIESGGDTWGTGYYTVGLDMADIDKDGRAEIFVARNAGENERYFVFNDRIGGFQPLSLPNTLFFGGVGATDIAAGDVNGDGKADLVVSYGEKITTRKRFEISYLNPPIP